MLIQGMAKNTVHDDLIQFGFARAGRVLRVLVVEDVEDQAMLLGVIIKRMGHQVRLAHTAHEALERATIMEPQVVFLDIGLPDRSGYELCAMMRRTPWGQSALIFAVTGRNDPSDLERSVTAGFDQHVVKPMEFKVLHDLLHRAEAKDPQEEQGLEP